MKGILLFLFLGFNVLVAASLWFKICAGCYRAWRPAQKAVTDASRSALLRNRGWAKPVWRHERAAQTT
jgi:hypothetical protein